MHVDRNDRRIDSVNEEVMAIIPAGTASASFASSPSERITSPSPGVDLVDGTPILDIKSFVPRFDTPKGKVAAGWFDTINPADGVTLSSLAAQSSPRREAIEEPEHGTRRFVAPHLDRIDRLSSTLRPFETRCDRLETCTLRVNQRGGLNLEDLAHDQLQKELRSDIAEMFNRLRQPSAQHGPPFTGRRKDRAVATRQPSLLTYRSDHPTLLELIQRPVRQRTTHRPHPPHIPPMGQPHRNVIAMRLLLRQHAETGPLAQQQLFGTHTNHAHHRSTPTTAKRDRPVASRPGPLVCR